MFRFFVDEAFDKVLMLSEEDSHHYLKVLRIKENELVEIVAENGNFSARFHHLEGKTVVLEKLKELKRENESPIDLALAFGILKNNNTEEILKYCTEVGVSEFYPLYTDRVVSKIEKKEDLKIARWEKIIESAAKQSKREIIPKLNSPVKIKDLEEISKRQNRKIIMAYEEEKDLRFDEGKKYNKILLVVGPEGGFTKDEAEALKIMGADVISLGRRILRAQTAAICASFYIIQSLERRDQSFQKHIQ
ncbi:RsmE family RNA methyltransferase [Peptoniphilus catoniae]|uniref:RsmE family RNA methyltransferase n=1 Tax=Peptoniphilus catoniae TaxID=1660341 RepID=UPI0010FD0C81|nr:RsmE family RNA methyltransferase [Peptoniphilus catoniae]